MDEVVKLSVVIVNYNVKYFLEQCLLSLRASLGNWEAEVFVVDNHSTDGSIAYLKPRFPEVIFVENADNPGFAKANNQALRRCRGEYVLLLNPDTVVGEESLRSLCFFLDEHPEAGGIGVKMIDGHGIFLPESKRSFPTPWVSFCKLFGLARLFPRSPRFARYALRYLDADKPHRVEVLAGAFMLMRHEVLDKVGLLDEAFFMYGEDIDLSYRLVLGGYANYYLPERLLHYKGESTKRGDLKYIRAFYGAMSIFFRKYYPTAGFFLNGIIRAAIGLKALQARLMPAGRGRKKKQGRRLLILCRAERLETIRRLCSETLPGLLSVNHWNLDELRAMDAICRSNRMKAFTDVAFSHPDLRFEQMLLWMDKQPDKRITYHIYSEESGRLVSPGK